MQTDHITVPTSIDSINCRTEKPIYVSEIVFQFCVHFNAPLLTLIKKKTLNANKNGKTSHDFRFLYYSATIWHHHTHPELNIKKKKDENQNHLKHVSLEYQNHFLRGEKKGIHCHQENELQYKDHEITRKMRLVSKCETSMALVWRREHPLTGTLLMKIVTSPPPHPPGIIIFEIKMH